MNPQTLEEAIGLASSMEHYVKAKGLGIGKKPKGEHVVSVQEPPPNKAKPDQIGKGSGSSPKKKGNGGSGDSEMYNRFLNFLKRS